MAAVTAIYAHHVLQGTGTFEIDSGAREMAARRADVLAKGLPYLVMEQDGRVLGFDTATGSPRPAYRFSAEDSIYLDPRGHGPGLGRALLAELAARAEAVG
jgi:phosphinothricin acetyltransferase